MAKRTQAAGRLPLLDKPRILYADPGTFSQSLFYGPLFLLGCVGALGCFFGTFQVPITPAPAIAVGLACFFFSLFLFLAKRPSWLVSLLGILAWLGGVWYFFDDLVQSCAHTINLVLEAYEEKLGMPLPFLTVTPGLSSQEISFQCTVFFCLFTFPYLFFLGWLLINRKSGFGTFCLTGLMLLFPMAISLVPPTPYLAALLLFWAVLLLSSHAFGARHRLLEDRGRFHAGGGGGARPSMMALLLGSAVLSMALTYFLVPYSTYERPKIAIDLWNGFTQGFGLNEALQGGVGNGNNQVKLSSLGARSYTGKTALRVRYQWDDTSEFPTQSTNQQKDYLKSFVGSVYTGGSWERLSSQDSAELRELLGGEHPQTLLDSFSTVFFSQSQAKYHLDVENVSANPRCVYTPYGLVASSVDEESLGYVEDGFLQSTRFFSGTPSYSLEAWGLPQQPQYYGNLVLTSVFDGYLNALDDSQNPASSRQDMVNDLWNRVKEDFYTEDGEPLPSKDIELWTIPQDLLECLDAEQQKLARTTEAYNKFVYEHYTQLPEDLRNTLIQFLEEQGIITNAPSSSLFSQLLLSQQIANILAARCTYTLTPPSLPSGRDFVEYFLFESHQGYCVHFATAAVALFRAVGLPARYAEGYAVPSGEEGWVDVPDYNAHAWVEIYLGGTGWIPVEVTPAGPDAPAATANARPPETQAATPTPTPTPSPSPTPTPTPQASPSAKPSQAPSPSSSPAPGAAEKEGSESSGLWHAVLGTVGGLLLAAAIVLLRRAIILKFRLKRFAQRDRNKAALELYASILELHRIGKKLLPHWQEELPSELKQLALKARFSQHRLTQEEYAVFWEQRQNAVKKKKKQLPLSKTLWCQYGLCLF